MILNQTVNETIETGTYDAVIETVSETTGNYGAQLRIDFRITGPTHEDATIASWVNTKFSPKSRLFELAQAAFGRPIKPGEKLDTDHLLGRHVKLVIVQRVKPDGTEYSKVDQVRPASTTEPF